MIIVVLLPNNLVFLALYSAPGNFPATIFVSFLHRPVPIALQWIDIHWLGVALVDEGCGVAVGKFSLYQTELDIFFSGSLDEALQLGGTGSLPSSSMASCCPAGNHGQSR